MPEKFHLDRVVQKRLRAVVHALLIDGSCRVVEALAQGFNVGRQLDDAGQLVQKFDVCGAGEGLRGF